MKLSKNLFLLIATISLLFITTTAFASNVNYNGKEMNLSKPIKLNDKGISYISYQDYATLNSMTYELDANNSLVYFTKGQSRYTLYLTQKKLETPSNLVSLDIQVFNGLPMLPIRQTNTAFGLYTAYDFNTNTILISDKVIQNIPKKEQPVSWSLPSLKLNKAASINVPILCYHVVSEGRADTLYTPHWKLEEHLKTLKANGYTAITPKQLYEAYYMKKPLPKKPILITFDDGYYDNYTLGYPLLQKYDMQATIFIVGVNIKETSNVNSNGGLPHLSWANILAMKSHVTVQNHTYASHSKGISPDGKSVGMIATRLKINGKWENNKEYWERIGKDFKLLEDTMKAKVGYGSYIFSYPYGQYSSTTKKVLEQLKIPMAVLIKSGIATKSSQTYELPRIIVNGNWSGKQLISTIDKLNKK